VPARSYSTSSLFWSFNYGATCMFVRAHKFYYSHGDLLWIAVHLRHSWEKPAELIHSPSQSVLRLMDSYNCATSNLFCAAEIQMLAEPANWSDIVCIAKFSSVEFRELRLSVLQFEWLCKSALLFLAQTRINPWPVDRTRSVDAALVIRRCWRCRVRPTCADHCVCHDTVD